MLSKVATILVIVALAHSQEYRDSDKRDNGGVIERDFYRRYIGEESPTNFYRHSQRYRDSDKDDGEEIIGIHSFRHSQEDRDSDKSFRQEGHRPLLTHGRFGVPDDRHHPKNYPVYTTPTYEKEYPIYTTPAYNEKYPDITYRPPGHGGGYEYPQQQSLLGPLFSGSLTLRFGAASMPSRPDHYHDKVDHKRPYERLHGLIDNDYHDKAYH